MEFEKYLKTNNLVPENKIKYFSNWADKFLHGINYIEWIERFQDYIEKNNANDVQDDDVRKFMVYLAVKQRVSASTQNQAFCAILFFLSNKFMF